MLLKAGVPLQGGVRAARALHPGLHHGHLPARPARHASRSCRHLRPPHHPQPPPRAHATATAMMSVDSR
jgi:hypothetical protein